MTIRVVLGEDSYLASEAIARVLEREQVPARHLPHPELRPHAGEADAAHDVGVRAAEKGRRHAQPRQVAHHVVRDGPVDLVLDPRVDLQA